MQHTQFCAKSAKNDLKPMDFLKRNFYFKTKGLSLSLSILSFSCAIDEHVC
jgi:hypothetical protein